MRKLAVGLALASTALATPAVARDGSGYVGIEGGFMIVEDMVLDYDDDTLDINDAVDVDFDTGTDVDVIGGYDFGAFRVEGELAYKRASINEIGLQDELANPQVNAGFFEADGRVSVLSGMVNGLLDFGDDGSWNGYLGGGIGIARVKVRGDIDDDEFGVDFRGSESGMAWQLIAGIRAAVSDNIDIGLKYRLFTARKLNFGGDFEDGEIDADLKGRLRTHSLLASLIYNFGAPPAPPPPPPPPPPPAAPATQTCPDGSVILATDVCPVPPPPPPPPPPEPERG
jgi:opacity protein-like surface antigen